jgi:hypothetical protein
MFVCKSTLAVIRAVAQLWIVRHHYAMRPQIASLIMSLNIGLILPVMYANGAACHLGWILLGVAIGFACYLATSLIMSRLSVAHTPKTFIGKQMFSMGYFASLPLAYFLVLLMVKIVTKR